MLLCDLTGDTKVSGQRWVPWDHGWWWVTPLSLGATFIVHLLGFSVSAELCLFG